MGTTLTIEPQIEAAEAALHRLTETINALRRQHEADRAEIERLQTALIVSNDKKQSGQIDLQSLGISQEQALQIRASLASFAEDWNHPSMDIYDDYDNELAKLRAKQALEKTSL